MKSIAPLGSEEPSVLFTTAMIPDTTMKYFLRCSDAQPEF